MSYLLLNDAGKIASHPYSLHQLRIDNPNTSFPAGMTEAALAEWRVYRVLPNSAPTVPHTQNVVEVAPTIIDGAWTQTWAVTDASADEIEARTVAQASAMRSDRNARLAASDWTQLADAPVDSAAWASYRQALRDVTAQAGFPWNVTWPDAP
jgi:hypothetical protein